MNENNSPETQKTLAEIRKLELEAERLRAMNNLEAEKLRADTAKVYKELRWYEIGLIIAGTVAVIAIARLLFA